MKRLLLSILSLCGLWNAACSSHSAQDRRSHAVGESSSSAPRHHFSNGSYWIGDRMPGNVSSIQISLAEQKASFYKGGKVAGVAMISTGRDGNETVVGNFRILEKDRNHKSTLFGNYVNAEGEVIQKDVDTTKDPKPAGAYFDGANMPCFMRITAGTGMHAGYLPGFRDSHGCIRMPLWMAEAVFDSVPLGTPVRIAP